MISELPTKVEEGTITATVTFTSVLVVGFTVAEGENEHAAPEGNPEQAKFTVPLKEPAAATVKLKLEDVVPRGTVTLAGAGAVREKSTTCRVRGVSWIVPSPPDPRSRNE